MKANGAPSVDELGIDFGEIALAVVAQFPGLTAEQRDGIRLIDQYLDEMSGEEHGELWTDEGLKSAAEWQHVRELAADVERRSVNVRS